ncbi:MAG: 2-succinyl-5-enolpyruvyl-6-hydroxy-3-cyclohexene-1-carboxylic-acid synthase [Acidimicrobiia bacterium]
MSRDATTACARTLVDEWARCGIADLCLAPGSRSTPLALAATADDRIRTHVHLDERSASFFGLGLAKATDRPVVLLCTSGTAATNFHPAVVEAHHGRVPLIVCTADRPPELRDTGAPQTIDQLQLYGSAVNWFVDVATPTDRPRVGEYWRSIASRAVGEALGQPRGPVHVNLPLREPLVPTGEPLVDAPGRPNGRPWTAVTHGRSSPDPALVDRITDDVLANPRGFLVAGWGAGVTPETARRFAHAAGWPILADPLSGLRTGDHAVSTYEALLRAEGFADAAQPDLVVRLGASVTSKVATEWLDLSVPQLLVDPDAGALDPKRAVSERMVVDPELLLSAVANQLVPPVESPWLHGWTEAEAVAREAIDQLLDTWADPFEGRIARDVVAALPDGATLAVASSMPVRDVESFAAPRDGVRFLANRGANGIDGFVSTVLGAAAGASSPATGDGPVVGLLGDLCFLHDSNGLLGATERGIDATLVVVDNDGGGIFSFLPQADRPERFEQLFGTPHGLDLVALCDAYKVPASRVEKATDLVVALGESIAAGGVHVVVVPTHRAENVARHREVWKVVARALD